jgi:hypothetical protein
MHAMGSTLGDVAQGLPLLLLPMIAAAVALTRETRPSRVRTPRVAWLWALSAASVVAAVVHAVVAPEHFGESALYGAFFLATTVFGLGYAVAVLAKPSRSLLLAGAAANLSIVVLWLFTRLVEVPIGPGAGEKEAFGVLDMVASSAELLCVVAAVSLLRGVTSRPVRTSVVVATTM